ncbi:hypothetical protein HR060_07495 [Catenovulum sp. SM1970]|uniref:hypothetical protein n=1 Tax=Marinifaba aquimaris TaxID=2741323 RepID=UPI001571FAD8|nr:hypothetical protein [Marinifaba aquimaris]NTS76711.1 hypothetical protein [Marinifaba aquimaris]
MKYLVLSLYVLTFTALAETKVAYKCYLDYQENSIKKSMVVKRNIPISTANQLPVIVAQQGVYAANGKTLLPVLVVHECAPVDADFISLSAKRHEENQPD